MTNNTSERDKEIDEAADKWEHETYDDYKDCYSFKEGARWADSHPTGKVLSDEDLKLFANIKRDVASRNFFIEDVMLLIELLERLTEQKPAGGER